MLQKQLGLLLKGSDKKPYSIRTDKSNLRNAASFNFKRFDLITGYSSKYKPPQQPFLGKSNVSSIAYIQTDLK